MGLEYGKTEMKHIILDVDGVLLDWEHGFQQWASSQHKVKFTSSRPTSWDLCEWTGREKEEVFELIKKFNQSPNFSHLFDHVDACVVLRELWGKGYNMTALSCYDAGGKSQMNRICNLHKKFGNIFEQIISLPLRVKKKDVLEQLYHQYGPCVFVEDNPEYALQGVQVGHEVFVLRREHNKLQEDEYELVTTWVDNFYQIRDAIK